MNLIWRFIKHFFWACLSLLITLVLVAGVVYTYMEMQLPDVATLKDLRLQVPLRVFSSDGKLIAQYGAKRRIPVTLDQIPKPLIEAVLATEDARYYQHPGVDFIGIVRAAKAVITSGRKVQGASTITMQVARNFFLTRKKTYSRKIKEILLALKIDKNLSKDKVLELYLNKVYFGNRAYGVAAAAQVYYGKTLDQLTLAQMAMIAGLPQAPSRNNPIANPTHAKARRDHVLARMVDVGFLDKKAYKIAAKDPITASYHGPEVQLHAPYIAEMVRQVMVAEYGDAAYDNGFDVTTTVSSEMQNAAEQSVKSGLIAYSKRHGFYPPKKNLGWPSNEKQTQWQAILKKLGKVGSLIPAAVIATPYQQVQALRADGNTITIDWDGLKWARPHLEDGYVGRAPKRASDIVQPGDVIWVQQAKNQQWMLAQIPRVQGALISMNPQNGALLALTGGFSYALSNFNRATQAQRQPGSNFKPFVYSAALAKGSTLATLINDAPVVLDDSGENALWRPQNDTLKFYGPTRLMVGLTKSRNLVSIRLLQATGIKYTLDYIKRFGFNPADLPHSLSLALGSATLTPMSIASGYSVFANGGYRVSPYFIQKVTDQTGKTIFDATPALACEACITNTKLPEVQKPQPVAEKVITPQNAYLMNYALQGVIQTGTGRAARVLKRSDLAGKTGTTNKQIDAWFSGFNSQVETTVWVGFDNMQSLHEYGSKAALPIWIHYMRTALKGMPSSSMPEPAGMVTVRIDPKTGLLARPGQNNAIFEVFRQHNQPTAFAPSQTVTVQAPKHIPTGGVTQTAAPAPATPNTVEQDEPLF